MSSVAAFAANAAILLVLCGCSPPEQTKEQRMANMKASCESAYGDRGETAVNECVLRLLTKAISQQEEEREQQAEKGAQ